MQRRVPPGPPWPRAGCQGWWGGRPLVTPPPPGLGLTRFGNSVHLEEHPPHRDATLPAGSSHSGFRLRRTAQFHNSQRKALQKWISLRVKLMENSPRREPIVNLARRTARPLGWPARLSDGNSISCTNSAFPPFFYTFSTTVYLVLIPCFQIPFPSAFPSFLFHLFPQLFIVY